MTQITRRAAAIAALTLTAAPAAATAQIAALENLQVHGYMNQGYGEASNLGIAGLPSADATGDYRTVALLFRYNVTEKDAFVVQLRHRRLGMNPIQAAEPAMSFNWAYYQRKFGPGIDVKLGKLPLPRGIYNEIRAVGTVLPFYRAPQNVYIEGYETVDGASIGKSFNLGKGWSFDASTYGGGFSVDMAVPDATGKPQLLQARAEAVHGTQTWLNTPLQGLRVGFSGMRFRSRKMTDTSTTPWGHQTVVSVDGTFFNRLLVRGEYNNARLEGGAIKVVSPYAQIGVQVTEKLSLNVQEEFQHNTIKVGPMTVDYRNLRDLAVGAKYAFHPGLVAKLEQHYNKGYNYDVPLNFLLPAPKGNYFIASVAASF
jgi:hypothetical protein